MCRLRGFKCWGRFSSSRSRRYSRGFGFGWPGGIWIRRYPVKFALGLFFLGAGFLVMAGAALVVAGGNKAWPTWLTLTYLLHTFGELCLSPVGLSSVTKLAPRKLAGQMMGIWFLATSLGNLLAGLLAGEFNPDNIQHWPRLYIKIVILPAIAEFADRVFPAT